MTKLKAGECILIVMGWIGLLAMMLMAAIGFLDAIGAWPVEWTFK